MIEFYLSEISEYKKKKNMGSICCKGSVDKEQGMDCEIRKEMLKDIKIKKYYICACHFLLIVGL